MLSRSVSIGVQLALFAIVLAGCGTGGGGGGGGGGGTISDQSRQAAIKGVEDKFSELLGQHLPKPQVNQAMADYMAAQPQFEEAGVSDDLCAWGRFKDGRLLVVGNNRDPEPVTDPDADPLRSPPGRAGAELPSSTDARLMHSFGPNFDQLQRPIDDVAAYLRAHGYQITPGTEGDARLATLRGVSGAGFFYLNTHGGKGKMKNGAETFIASSSTLQTTDNDRIPIIADDWNNNRLAYYTGANGNTTQGGLPQTDTRYGINAAFVDTYMSFAPRSVVFMNVCFSAKTDVPDGAQAFIAMCHKKGAGVYLGWTRVVFANPAFRAVRYFVDRMLGHNKKEPESPKQRPFAYDEILTDMKNNHGYGFDASTGATLEAFAKPGVFQPITLTPSIEQMLVNEPGRELVLKGLFGKQIQPTVTINGRAVTVNSWAEDEIKVQLANTGPAAAGEVIVDVSGRKSNPRRLTEWIIPLQYSFRHPDHEDVKVAGTIVARFRADIGEYREQPHVDPIKPVRGAVATQDSGVDLMSEGSYADSDCTVYWENQQSFPAVGYGPVQFNLVARFKVDTDAGTGALGLGLAAFSPPFNIRTVCPDGTSNTPFMVAIGLLYNTHLFPDPDPNSGRPAVPLPAIEITFGPNYRIPAGVFEELRADGVIRIEWTAVNPNFPPDQSAPRSAKINGLESPTYKRIDSRKR